MLKIETPKPFFD